MPDRIVRADILESPRWLDLSSDTHRLVYLGILLCVDDFGNVEGGRRLWRKVHGFSQIKTEQDFVKLMSELQDVDLVRRYTATTSDDEQREYWHVPRFRNLRRYTSRKCPISPWCDATAKTTLEKIQAVAEKPAADLQQTCSRPTADLLRGVGAVAVDGEVEASDAIASVSSDFADDPLSPSKLPNNGSRLPGCPHKAIVELYHETLPELPKVLEWNETRQRFLRQRWREKAAKHQWANQTDGLAWFKDFFAFIGKSKFLTGKTNGSNGRPPFIADLEWIVRPTNWVRIVEGKYS